jgi:Fe-S-cluster containining protein
MSFVCPPDCGWCCTHLARDAAPGEAEFRAVLREHGVYHCTDGVATGLSLSNAEAARFRELGAPVHPRTFLLEARRRVAVVLDWHMPRDVCPFYADYQCTAYQDRPLVCRAFPVMVASPLRLAPECPKVPAPRAALRLEVRARTAIERAHATLDDQAARVLAAGRFAVGLPAREAAARLRRCRVETPEAYLARAA